MTRREKKGSSSTPKGGHTPKSNTHFERMLLESEMQVTKISDDICDLAEAFTYGPELSYTLNDQMKLLGNVIFSEDKGDYDPEDLKQRYKGLTDMACWFMQLADLARRRGTEQQRGQIIALRWQLEKGPGI